MKEIILATTNPAKVTHVRSVLSNTEILVSGLPHDLVLPEVIEDGATANENARKKALTYAMALGIAVMAMDNALYIEGLPDDQQPGLHVKRIPGHIGEATDEQMLEYYTELIASLGGQVGAYWELGICLASPAGEYRETTISVPRTLVSSSSPNSSSSYYLEKIQVDSVTGRYFSDMTKDEIDRYWQETMGEILGQFILSTKFED